MQKQNNQPTESRKPFYEARTIARTVFQPLAISFDSWRVRLHDLLSENLQLAEE
jgi:hypothetical protein